MYNIKGENNNYETSFDLMDNENILDSNANFVRLEENEQDITFYDFIKNSVDILCKNCGNNAKNASSGNNAKNASSGNNAKNASSGDYAQNASSGDYAKNASSGDYAKNASSGDYAKNASSGYNAQNASSGYNAQNASSGYNAQNASSGNNAKNASSGDNAQNASSGNNAKNASSGDYAKNASSGYNAQNASSGYNAQNASSGDYAKNASSGDYAKNASSGDYAKNIINGKYSVDTSCGYRTVTKGINGTLFCLTDYTQIDRVDENGNKIWKPTSMKCGEIGVSLDFKGNILAENQFYMLINNDFIPINIIDEYYMIPTTNIKKIGEYEVYSAIYEKDFREHKEKPKIVYIAQRDSFTAHGKTIKEAIADVEFKFQQSQDCSEHITRVKNCRTMTANDYRLITGACRSGTERFLEANGYEWTDTKTIEEVIKITQGQYGHDTLIRLLEDNGND